MSFKMTNNLQSATNLAKVVYANQLEEPFNFEGVTGSNLQSTSALEFVVGWQGPAAPISANAGTSCGIEFKSLPNSKASLIDFHSTPGYFNNTYDFRMQCSGGATGIAGIGQMICLGERMDIRCPINAGSGAPLFKLDYGRVGPLLGVTNPQTPIVFTAGLFTTNPNVYLTVVSPITNETNAQPVFVESLTTAGCNVDFIGVPNSSGSGTFVSWLALGV